MSCETETGPVRYMEDPVAAGTTAVLSGFLTDESGADLQLTDLQALTLTLRDVASDTVINGRSAQNVLNANDGTVDVITVDGVARLRFRQILTTTDNVILGSADFESHSALFTWTYDTTHIGKIEVIFSVKRL